MFGGDVMPNFTGYIPKNRIVLITQNVDFRMSVNGLTSYIQEIINFNPMSESCFVFCNKQHNKLKIIEWDYNGFWLYYKRLESGRFVWPSSSEEYMDISINQFEWLMNGLSITQRDGFEKVLATKVV